MSLLDPLRRFIAQGMQRDVDKMRDQADAALDEIERQGKGLQVSDDEWTEMKDRLAKLEKAGVATQRDRARLARFAKIAGR